MFALDEWDYETTRKATGFLANLCNYGTVVSVVVAHNCLELLSGITNKLQSREMLLPQAMALIDNVIETIENVLKNISLYWDEWLFEIDEIAEGCNIEVKMPRIPKSGKQDYRDQPSESPVNPKYVNKNSITVLYHYY